MTRTEAIAAVLHAVAWRCRVKRARNVALYAWLSVAMFCVMTNRFGFALLALAVFSLTHMVAQNILIFLRPHHAIEALRRYHAQDHSFTRPSH